ncbi:hypothetical protein [Mucilaginibacter paludis]|uniref:Uncharacterized protein n=1 Tax=Mucilaginibacter paludis DSM 18603 TaxID=714943 RepID=H1XZA2_9SPHI|nr:hypothetical protein [Mucilaginibacter paludis]EHQ25590.1 hypothetical protein Mucpa_1432 [Mucilaginibacter paludis DSM 18603]
MYRKKLKRMPYDIEKKDSDEAKKVANNEENSDSLVKLIAEITVKNIIEKYRNGRNGICESP